MFVNELFSNVYFYVPFATWILGQSLKFVINLFYGRFDFKYLVASGGMPSVHTAVVASLTTVAALKDGPSSPLFGVLLVLSGIVVYDSFGVRRASGEQAKLLNSLVEDLSTRRALANSYDHLRVFLGHKPIEVLVGGILGSSMGLLMTRFQQSAKYFSPTFLFGSVKDFPFLKPFLFFFGFFLVAAVVVKGLSMIWGLRGAKKKLAKYIFWWASAGGVFGLLYASAAFENIPGISYPIIFAVGMLVWAYFGALILKYYFKKFRHEHNEWLEEERKKKYLP